MKIAVLTGLAVVKTKDGGSWTHENELIVNLLLYTVSCDGKELRWDRTVGRRY